MDNNAEFIYNYTANTVESIEASTKIVTGKLTQILAFSGVMLKVAADMHDDGYLFSIKILVFFCLLLAIGMCAAGLWPKDRGKTDLPPAWLLEGEQYGLSQEEMYLTITRAFIRATPQFEKVRDYRSGLLKKAVGLLVFSGILFSISEIVSSIH